ncbi:CCA tRNA nucleotidyltransferase [Staphylococcus felis]|uniref:CCA-adding enzyme n=1 Tax=Staphylococcus felis TaxID=46127 RepID=A0A3E0IPB3_9STAP|nr:CCA tRNA nucleotidyltransferase [Staphylococcus felis]REH94823.1 CCA tRNA nucleotidyltransferase [Staphylococcus felis]
MNISLPFVQAIPILKHIQKNGFEAYFVGGSVRDFIMNREINDVDITTSATPDEIESLFTHTIPVGKEHGTINVVWENENYEITTFRTESEYINHRRPSEVHFVRDLYLDVKRRDFTINAIAMDTEFNLYDYFNGQADINNKVIRTVGKPVDRFSEDALRIIRGLRFKSQLGFDIDSYTFRAMEEHIEDIQYLSIERIILELKKLLLGQYINKAIIDLHHLNFWEFVPYFNLIQMNAYQMIHPITLEQFIAITTYKSRVNQDIKCLKLSNASTNYITQFKNALIQLNCITNEKSLYQFVYDFGISIALDIEHQRENLMCNHISLPSQSNYNASLIQHIWQSLPIQNRKMLQINGKDLMEVLNKNSGPWLKKVLRDIECAVVQSEVANRKKDLIEWVKLNVKIS